VTELLLGVDGGNSKTDAVLVDGDGRLVAAVRGPGCSPDALGLAGTVRLLDTLIGELRGRARAAGYRPDIGHGTFFLAGLDGTDEEAVAAAAFRAAGWARQVHAGNDSLAVLYAAGRGWGVALVCGAGINAVGVTEDGRRAGYPALGALTGDWGGGEDVGLAALRAAVRADDRRGPPTTLAVRVPETLGYPSAQRAGYAIFHRQADPAILHTLAPVVFAECRAGDEVSAGIVDRLAGELVDMALGVIRRLDLAATELDVVLGGGLLQAGEARLLAGVERGIRLEAPWARPVRLTVPPVAGAVWYGGRVAVWYGGRVAGWSAAAQRRLRYELETRNGSLLDFVTDLY
jgi:N-acetylglucosamine kinase-like BadF-type ATPase